MYVSDLDDRSYNLGGREWTARVRIYVRNVNGSSVGNALVNGYYYYNGAYPASCVTGGQGWCEISVALHNSVHTITFSVSSATHNVYSYDASRNSDPDNDSDGTTITLERP
jgi:hypothetical protein